MVRVFKRGRQYYDADGVRYDPMAVMQRGKVARGFEIVDENKPVPLKQTVVSVGKPNNRMAGEQVPAGLDDLISEIQEEGRQEKHLAKQLARFADIDSQFEAVGVPHKVVTDLQEVGQLVGGAPAPYVMTGGNGNERRVHTQREVNPFTGEQEIVPVKNERTGNALVTEFGMGVDLEGEDKASEYVQDHILRLMGYNPQRGPVGKVDFYVEKDGKRIGIDGQTQQTGNPPVVEAFTKVIPANRKRGGYGRGYAPNPRNPDGKNTPSNVKAIREDVRSSLTNAMNEGRTFDEAMNFLVDGGYIIDDRNMAGKLYKADYDGVLMPMQNQKQHVLNARRDDIAIAPDDVLFYGMADVRNAVKNIRNPKRIKDVYNAGNDQQGEARVKLRANVPEQYVHNVVKEHPMVGQVLRNLQYE